MDGECKTHGKLIMQRKVWPKILRDRNHFEKLGVEGMILTLILKKNRVTAVDWIHLAQDIWLAAVNTVLKVHILHLRGTSEPIPSTQGEFCSMESEPFTETS